MEQGHGKRFVIETRKEKRGRIGIQGLERCIVTEGSEIVCLRREGRGCIGRGKRAVIRRDALYGARRSVDERRLKEAR